MKKLYFIALLSTLALTTLAIPKLNSFPSATATIFLDFDGQYVYGTIWNDGAPLNCAPSGMPDADITEAFNRVAEDYRPFNINITTDSTVYFAAPLTKRIRIIVTPTSSWYPGVGGISYVGSFKWGDDTPGFVFCDRLGPNSPKMVGECCSHESGHTLGLSHQSKYGSDCTTPVEQYNTGAGLGEPSWAPIMGNSYSKNMSNWNNGPTPYGCTSMQDNLSIITTQNGFGYRTDDYAETMNGSTTLLGPGNFSTDGIITTNTDKDAFKFSVNQNSNFHLTATPFNVGANNSGANLDIKMELYNNAGTLINTYDPVNSMGVTVDTVLNAGTYYVKIDGSGNINIGEYGSIGSYTLSGTTVVLAIHNITLSGTTANDMHNLAWNIAADEAVRSIDIEIAADGSNYKALTSVTPGAVKFSYTPFENNAAYYRLKVTSVIGQTAYSNAIFLKGINGKTDNNFKVSTLIENEITVHASVPYEYQLSDINGRLIRKGNGVKGFNSLSLSNQPRGMYILQLFSNNQNQSERIIKQ